MQTAATSAEIWAEALPYIKKQKDSVLLIKIGGSTMIDKEVLTSILTDISLLKYLGIKPVVVHGGGPFITSELEKLDIKAEFHRGMRKTPKKVMEMVKKVLVGQVNSMIVEHASTITDCRAAGLYGGDGNLIEAEKYRCDDGTDLGYVGRVKKINPGIVNSLLSSGYLPFIAPVGVGENGSSYNINSDMAASEIAAALKADKFIVLTDVEGVMTEPGVKNSLIKFLSREQAKNMINRGSISEGMIPKVKSCMQALKSGVNFSYILNGTRKHILLQELLTGERNGTMMKAGRD